jgi:hypothetical protein
MTCIAILLCLDASLLVIKFGLGHQSTYGLTYLFDLNLEQNIPTLFSTLDLAFASLLLWTHSRKLNNERQPDSAYWLGLSIIFAFLATDEFCSIHERLNKPVEQLLHTTNGALLYAWVVPYAAFVLIFAAVYLRFWWRMPTRYRILFAVAGSIYVVGALGLEMIGAELDSIYGIGASVAEGIEIIVEEGMEMSGIALFVYALLCSLRDRGTIIRFTPDAAELSNLELLKDVQRDKHKSAA